MKVDRNKIEKVLEKCFKVATKVVDVLNEEIDRSQKSAQFNLNRKHYDDWDEKKLIEELKTPRWNSFERRLIEEKLEEKRYERKSN